MTEQLTHLQTGETVGIAADTVGLLAEHPRRRPKAVSSSAASNAAPQFGSLDNDQSSAARTWNSWAPSWDQLEELLTLRHQRHC